MTNEINVIKKETVLEQEFTVYGTAEEPLFLAKDVAKWIDYSKTSEGFYNVSKMLMNVDEDEKVTITISNSEGKPHSQSFLTENGLYEVLMLSRKPVAKQFKKEVKKILHEIRTTGGYTVPKTYGEALQLAANQQKQIEQQKAQIAELKPLADGYQTFLASHNSFTMQKAAAMLKDKSGKSPYGRNNLIKRLKREGILQSNGIPYRPFIDNGYFEVRSVVHNGISYTTALLFPKGMDYLGKKLGLIVEYTQESA